MLAQKPITFLAIAQTGALVIACLVSAMVYRLQSVILSTWVPERFPTRTAYLMSHWGWLLLILPLVWLIAAMKFNRFQGDSLRGNLVIYCSGALLAGGYLFMAYSYAAALFLSIAA